jgi:hypothetical protein
MKNPAPMPSGFCTIGAQLRLQIDNSTIGADIG